jgi:hypothetical protein
MAPPPTTGARLNHDPSNSLEGIMNVRSRRHALGQALTLGIVFGVPVLLLAAFALSAHITLTPAKSAEADPLVATQALGDPVAADPVPVTQVAPAPRAAIARAAAKAAPAPEAKIRQVTRAVLLAIAPLPSRPQIHVASLCSQAALSLVSVDAVLACEDGMKTAGASSKSRSYSYGYNDDVERDFYWALVQPQDDGVNTIGSTDRRATRVIHEAARESKEPFLYVRVDGRDRLIRDAALIEKADEIVEPMQVLGKKMGELGGRQGQLGGQQGRLGARQGQLGARQGLLAGRNSQIASKMASRSRRGLDTADLEAEQRKLEAEQEALSEEMGELGRQQEALGEKQSVLGAEQERYGKQMQTVNRQVESEIRELTEKAIQAGKAKAVGYVDA